MKKYKNVACYIRVSTQEQKLHGLSLDAQRDKLFNFSEKKGFKIVAWYEDEGVSGRKVIKKRPALQRMLSDVPSGAFDRIIFIKLDRYFRSVAEYHICQKLLDEHDVVWTATEEKYDISTANGRAFVNLKLSIAEYEADQTGERIRLVNDYKAKTGQPLYGNVGLAFRIVETNGRKHIIRNPETEDMVRDLLSYFMEHQSKRGTMAYINQKYNENISYRRIGLLLENELLSGSYRGNDNYCEAYLTKEEHEKLKAILKKNIKTTSIAKTYLFTGLVRCPACGRIMGGTSCSYRRNKAGEKVKTHNQYYRCPKANREHACDWNKTIAENKIEKKLLACLDEMIHAHLSVESISDLGEKAVDHKKEIEALNKELDRLNTMYQKGRISEDKYDMEYNKAEDKIKALQAEEQPQRKARDLEQYKALLESDWRTLYNALTKENKRTFWRRYIKEIQLDSDKNITPIFY